MPVSTSLSLGNYPAGAVIDMLFTSYAADWTPTAIVGGAAAVYKGSNTTQSGAGLTYSTGFDLVVGLNHINIDTEIDETFYVDGNDFSIVMTAGTVGGVSVAGYVVGRFTIGRFGPVGPVVLGPTGLDAVVIETSLNARQALSIIAAANSGDITAVDNGDGTWTFSIAGAGVATARITALGNTDTKERDVTITPPT